MKDEVHVPLAPLLALQREAPRVAGLKDIQLAVQQSLAALQIPTAKVRGKKIGITAGSRGIDRLPEVVRAACLWLKSEGATPFIVPAMGSHGGGTSEGQRQVLEKYGVTPEFTGAEICSAIEPASLGTTPEGIEVYIDRNAYEADAVLVLNRVKPHTDFSGNIESGVVKMIAVGLGKAVGAQEVHRWSRQIGFEPCLRAVCAKVLSSGKILCGLALIENEFHQIAQVYASAPEGITAQEEKALIIAKQLVPRIPFPELDLLVVDELGKNISGSGMDTKVIGRGLPSIPPEAPHICVIYARDLTRETEGNAAGVGLADLIHDRLYRKIDYQKTFLNVRTSLNLPLAQVPMHCPSDRDAFDFALGYLGSPGPEQQRSVWIRNTVSLDRIACSQALAAEASKLDGWHLEPEPLIPQFDREGNVCSPLQGC
ncbi:MAG TPA: DUF362 domain-containing protein [Terriglobia bacterium]|nr:DUF362 domain-containing protein [Terriglobia bacterium]